MLCVNELSVLKEQMGMTGNAGWTSGIRILKKASSIEDTLTEPGRVPGIQGVMVKKKSVECGSVYR